MINGWSWASQYGLYRTKEWRELRELKVHESPICEICVKMHKIVTVHTVDHIIPITKANYKELFLDYENLQSLCEPCHRFKTNRDKVKKKGLTGKALADRINSM